MIKSLIQLVSKLKSLPGWIIYGSPLKQDESVIFFPSCANKLTDGCWNVPVRAWVFELEENSLERRLGSHILAELLEIFEVTEEQAHSAIFKERIKWFLVDNERNKRITFSLGRDKFTMPRSCPNGHTRLTFSLADDNTNDWCSFQSLATVYSRKTFTGEVEFVSERGLSVISDIDDTLKISNVPDKQALLKNIFFNKYKPVAGMPELYQNLLDKNASFHYLSASPWALYPSLKPFLDTFYPKGSILLRHFRVLDSSFIKFFMSSQQYKTDAIRYMLRRFPHRNFMLIGDSSEKDPEIFAGIYTEFPDAISQILIRKTPGSALSKTDIEIIFQQVPDEKWVEFDQPDEIQLRV
ncbi:MAG: App1 family protein [Gammaproteobacteria bacterium]